MKNFRASILFLIALLSFSAQAASITFTSKSYVIEKVKHLDIAYELARCPYLHLRFYADASLENVWQYFDDLILSSGWANAGLQRSTTVINNNAIGLVADYSAAFAIRTEQGVFYNLRVELGQNDSDGLYGLIIYPY